MSRIENFRKVLAEVPSRQRPPSERNLQIYEAVRVAGRSQREVAESLGVRQQRISQIVRRVEQWRLSSELAQRLAGEDAERGGLEERLERGRLEQVYQTAMRNLGRPRREVKSVRKRYARRGEWSEQTVREWEGDPRLLKAALRSLDALDKLAGRPATLDAQAAWLARSWITVETLVELRREAIGEGRVPRDPSARRVVESLLRDLTGTDLPVGEDEPEEANGTYSCSAFCRNDASGDEVTASGIATSRDGPASCDAAAEPKSGPREAAP